MATARTLIRSLSKEQQATITQMVEEYLRDVLEIDLARQHAQAALGLEVDEV